MERYYHYPWQSLPNRGSLPQQLDFVCLRQHGGWHHYQQSMEMTGSGGVQHNQHALEDDSENVFGRHKQYDLYHHRVGSRGCSWKTVVVYYCAEVADCYAKIDNYLDDSMLGIVDYCSCYCWSLGYCWSPDGQDCKQSLEQSLQ